ncbi:Demethylmenaquinone methyltransferase [Candidatus Entotheonellaceae bacterium PAL068K]
MHEGVTPEGLRWRFGCIARRYDLTNRMISASLDHYWRRRLAQRVAARPARIVLNIACGTGGVMLQIARQGAVTTQLIGIDFTETMLRVGQGRLARVGLCHRVHMCAADAHRLP